MDRHGQADTRTESLQTSIIVVYQVWRGINDLKMTLNENTRKVFIFRFVRQSNSCAQIGESIVVI